MRPNFSFFHSVWLPQNSVHIFYFLFFFCVKSILGMLEVRKLPFLQFWKLRILIFDFYFFLFLQFLRIEIYYTLKFRSFKTAKMAVFTLGESLQLISRKILSGRKTFFPHCVSTLWYDFSFVN